MLAVLYLFVLLYIPGLLVNLLFHQRSLLLTNSLLVSIFIFLLNAKLSSYLGSINQITTLYIVELVILLLLLYLRRNKLKYKLNNLKLYLRAKQLLCCSELYIDFLRKSSQTGPRWLQMGKWVFMRRLTNACK